MSESDIKKHPDFAHSECPEVEEGPPAYDDSIENTRPSRIVWLISSCVAIGGLLFGYDTGVISAVLVTLGDDLGHTLTSNEKELITSITSGAALIGALIAGLPADKYGRKIGIYLGCVLFLIGSVIQASSFTLAQMTVGRFVVGLGVGSAAMIVPLYIGEISPASYRGRMIALDALAITGGQLISYALGAGLAYVPNGWRWMVAIGGFPPIILCALLPLCPESPRQLLAHRRADEATRVIARVYPHASPAQVRAKIEHMQWVFEQEAEHTRGKSLWWQFKQLHVVPSNFRALVSTCAVMAISQLGGFNTLMYYSGTLFGLIGFDDALAVSIVVGATNFVFTIVNMLVVDKLGRRRTILISTAGMSASLVVSAVAFHWIPISKDLVLEATSVNWAGKLILVTIIVYIGFYATGIGNVAWLGTELYPLEVRALGTMMITVTCWGSNLIIASTYLSMMKGITPSGAFGFFAGICFFGFIFIYFCYPEAVGLPLEDIRQVFENGFGVKVAARLQKERKAKERLQKTTETEKA